MSAITPLAIITVVHVLGLVALLCAAFAAGEHPRDEGDGGRDDGRGGMPRPPSGRPPGGPPLDDAAPSQVRLRGPVSLGDLALLPRERRGPGHRLPAFPATGPTRACARTGGCRP